MRRDHVLVVLFSWFVPVLTTTTTCPCWNEIIQDIHPSSETPKFAAGGLCDYPSLLVQLFEECITRERCASVDVRDQEHRLRELCSTDKTDIDLRRGEELRRRAGKTDSDSDPTPTDSPSPSDSPTSKPKKGSSTAKTSKATTQFLTKTSTTSEPSSTTTTDDSSSTSSTTESSSTSITTSNNTPTSTSSPTAPAASATQTSSPSSPAMGPGSIAAASIFAAFAAGCVGFLAFVCFRRVKRNRESRKKESMDEQLLSGAAKPDGSHRSISGSSRSIDDTQSMYADRHGSAASIPLADRQSGYAQRLYPLGGNSYQPAPQHEPRDAYNPNGDYGDLGRQPGPYSIYSSHTVSHSPAPEQSHGYWPPFTAHQGQHQGWEAAPIAPIRNMRSGSGGSSRLSPPATLTPGERLTARDTSGFTAGGYPRQHPAVSPPRSRSGA